MDTASRKPQAEPMRQKKCQSLKDSAQARIKRLQELERQQIELHKQRINKWHTEQAL